MIYRHEIFKVPWLFHEFWWFFKVPWLSMTFPENFSFPGFPDPVGTLLEQATCKHCRGWLCAIMQESAGASGWLVWLPHPRITPHGGLRITPLELELERRQAEPQWPVTNPSYLWQRAHRVLTGTLGHLRSAGAFNHGAPSIQVDRAILGL